MSISSQLWLPAAECNMTHCLYNGARIGLSRSLSLRPSCLQPSIFRNPSSSSRHNLSIWTRTRPVTQLHQPFSIVSRNASTSTPVSEIASSVSPSVPAPPPSWLDHLPRSLTWTRPYFELSRLDKPIGSWLLYWPCGETSKAVVQPVVESLTASSFIDCSLVNYNGSLFLRVSHIVHNISTRTLWYWCRCDARSRMHHKRPLGPRYRQQSR